jgi:hypothetical protein
VPFLCSAILYQLIYGKENFTTIVLFRGTI